MKHAIWFAAWTVVGYQAVTRGYPWAKAKLAVRKLDRSWEIYNGG